MKTIKCPYCKSETTWANNPFRPFCSERCKDVDLGKWANEEYKVPVEEADNGDESAFSPKKGNGETSS